jgi:hypothetical protein
MCEVRFEHDLPGEPWEDEIPALVRASVEQLKCPAIFLNKPQAEAVFEQFQETAEHRKWSMSAVAIMHNHFHIVVQVEGAPLPRKFSRTLKPTPRGN